ncbi:MAG: HAD-IIB family hydrolase [Candidatus Paceibacterota bacterium]|jgi:hypothetical protein
MYKLIIFDLDGTLAESKQPLTHEMALALTKLLSHTRVAVISGGAFSQFLKQVVAQLPVDAQLAHLSLLPTSGAALYEFEHDDWKKIYEERLTEREKDTIEAALRAAGEETGLIDFSKKAHGERIEYRGGQVTLSALGQEAPIALKKAWDPKHEKRLMLRDAVVARLRGFSVSVGGATSIDVTKSGIDKAYGIQKLCERLHIPESKALYVGDELGTGGNDEAVYKTAVTTCVVENPSDTLRTIKTLLSAV